MQPVETSLGWFWSSDPQWPWQELFITKTSAVSFKSQASYTNHICQEWPQRLKYRITTIFSFCPPTRNYTLGHWGAPVGRQDVCSSLLWGKSTDLPAGTLIALLSQEKWWREVGEFKGTLHFVIELFFNLCGLNCQDFHCSRAIHVKVWDCFVGSCCPLNHQAGWDLTQHWLLFIPTQSGLTNRTSALLEKDEASL